MLRRFGWFYSALGLGRTLRRLRLEDHSAEQIRRAASQGPVVYVLPRRSTIDHLALNTVLVRRRLPLSVWAHGTGRFWWQPVAEAWTELAHRARSLLRQGPPPDPVTSGWVCRAVAAGEPVTVFLDDPPTVWQRLTRRSRSDSFQALLDAQERTDRPIHLLPVLVVWDRAPEVDGSAVRQFLLANRPTTGLLVGLRNAWQRSRKAFVQVGEPLELSAFARRVDPERHLKALRKLVWRHLRRESTLVRGPRLLPHHVMKQIVLDNPPMRALAEREARERSEPIHQVMHRMQRDFDKIAARFRWWVILALHLLLRPLWTKVFSGVEVTDEDLDRIRSAMRGGTAILIPCHKSHFDYLLLSWVFFENDLVVPHVVAGMNLAIWPLSILLRGAGGFFIQRSFAGDRVFPAVFARYLRELVRQGYPVEFFIEGGRTRTGRLLPPRVGVLGMVLDAAELRPTGHEVTLLPIALSYEQVAEESAYAREQSGEAKRPESMGQLVRARSVLRRRFGKVYLRVGEPVACSGLVDAHAGAPAWSKVPREQQKQELHRLGDKIVHRIGSVMTVLPTSLVSLALLAHHRRGIQHDALLGRVRRFHAFLLRQGAPGAASLQHLEPSVTQALERFLRNKMVESFEHGGQRIWAIVPDRRLALDFHKNQVLHYFARASLASAAIRALEPSPFLFDDVLPGFRRLITILRQELVFDPDHTAEEHLAHALSDLVQHGGLVRSEDGRYGVADAERMGELHGLVRGLLESYLLVLRCGSLLEEAKKTDAKALARSIQDEGPAFLGSGVITRPESLSMVTLQSAIRSHIDDGVLEPDAHGALAYAHDARDRTLAWLTPMVDG